MPAAAERRATSSIQHTSWSKGRDWRAGTMRGVRTAKGSLLLKKPRPGRLHGRSYQAGSWTSPWASPGFGATALIPSWEAVTTGDSVVKVAVRARTADGRTSSWDSMAEWALDNPAVRRQSLAAQTDDLGRVNVDTWVAAAPVTQWQVRVTLYRGSATRPLVRVDRIGAVASALVPRGDAPTSAPGPAAGTVLDVPTYSQMTHGGHYPQWGGGGEAWCSPTSLAMVLGSYGLQPGPFPDIAAGHADAQVDHTARMVYDHRYGGTGNWAFNTAYASTLTSGDAYVTRFGDLRGVEDLIVSGVPVVISVAFGRAPAHRRPHHRQQRPPAGRGRLRGRRRRGRQRPRRREQRRGPPGLRPRRARGRVDQRQRRHGVRRPPLTPPRRALTRRGR